MQQNNRISEDVLYFYYPMCTDGLWKRMNIRYAMRRQLHGYHYDSQYWLVHYRREQ